MPNNIFTTVVGFQAADFDITNSFVNATGANANLQANGNFNFFAVQELSGGF